MWFWGINLGAKRHRRWGRVRAKHLEKQPECQICSKTRLVQVHHILPFWKYPELETVGSNLVTLCRKHHFHFGHISNWKNYNPNILKWIEDINKQRPL